MLSLPLFSLRRRAWTLLSLVLLAGRAAAADAVVASPDGALEVRVSLNAEGAPRYAVSRAGRPVLAESRLGLVRDDTDFSRGLALAAVSPVEPVSDRYEMLTAKRRAIAYAAHRRVFHFATAAGAKLDVVFQVSNDGVAFRYVYPESDGAVRKLSAERTSFKFLPETRAWLQPMSVAKTGWKRTNPSYEEYYLRDVPSGTPSALGAGWAYPALFRSGDTWLLLSETALGRDYCGTRLVNLDGAGEYGVGFPDPQENFRGGPVAPEARLPWSTPWRLMVVGSLATVVESTLGLDLAEPPSAAVAAAPRPAPGKASWSWPLLGDRRTDFETQRRFIDYAADMGWRYCLIDALWDAQIGEARIRELVEYGRAKNVVILLWYNSGGDWNDAPQTPRDRLLTRESRHAEFEKLKALGVAGLKVDFFGGDGQSMIGYYHDLLEETAPYGFAMNFHGATLPRGWQRTYPHLMTVEAIRGLEFITFEQTNADQAPTHTAMLPFTRNVFDPMDFTPVVLDRINRIERRTSSAFELALSVLFTSGIQHYAEIPEGLAKAPAGAREFLRGVPSVWDDVKFLDGFPGRYVALARRGDGRWYLAGINADETPRVLTLELSALGAARHVRVITDGAPGNLSFREETIPLGADRKLKLTLAPRGGFVGVVE